MYTTYNVYDSGVFEEYISVYYNIVNLLVLVGQVNL
jgi:hypothetical protein